MHTLTHQQCSRRVSFTSHLRRVHIRLGRAVISKKNCSFYSFTIRVRLQVDLNFYLTFVLLLRGLFSTCAIAA